MDSKSERIRGHYRSQVIKNSEYERFKLEKRNLITDFVNMLGLEFVFFFSYIFGVLDLLFDVGHQISHSTLPEFSANPSILLSKIVD